MEIINPHPCIIIGNRHFMTREDYLAWISEVNPEREPGPERDAWEQDMERRFE